MHVGGSIRDAASGGRDLDGTGASLVGNGDVGKAATLAELGLVRTFQGTTLFHQLSVFDNVRLGCHRSAKAGLLKRILGGDRAIEEAANKKARDILAFFGLQEMADELASNLAHGHQRALGVAVASKFLAASAYVPAAAADAGAIATQAHVYAEAGSSTFMLSLAETYAPLVATTGQLPAADVEAWLADQRRSASDGTFFAACNYYAYVARR